ncbi:CGNR zinc finger domain-containing protein [Brevibacterium sp. p3-SID960]|uniref:CGNR zinc finger domain-containing protein n=1 Tax=Brevibacterium sp. p3-SID960 TaxID=2916063 RepID=UPI0021A40EB0|nr:CGNR zinc finger domain-containing protein [Brevibacterium sp. p3-SID960]MCT1690030.1 CGNR zinc finger domain-containing protein [Brevibacterium sp. p3-SID960]
MKTTWAWLGDHLAVDFANTIKVVDNRTIELIGSIEEFHDWHEAEPADLPTVDLTSESLRDLRNLRDCALRLLRAACDDRTLPQADVATINETIEISGTLRLLGSATGTSRLQSASEGGFDALAGLLAAAVVDLLAREDLANIAVCSAPSCGQFFHRARPNQVWCSPGCGNRARVDRHRHRRMNATGMARR